MKTLARKWTRAHQPKLSSILLIALLLSLSFVNGVAAGQSKAQPVELEEWGVKVIIPDGLPVCFGDSGTHVHGVYTRLDKKGCKDAEDGPYLSLWADYNVAFQSNALEILHGASCSNVAPSWARGEWTNAIAGLRTALCRVDHTDGKTNIVLAAQSGIWGEGFEEESDKPHFNYTVSFASSKPRLERDLKTFKAFLKSIVITKPR